MLLTRVAAILVAITYALPRLASAETHTLTLEQARAWARERAPALISARGQVEEAEARARAARVLLRDNPVVDGAIGPRRTPGEEETTDLRIGVTQAFPLGGDRGARIAGGEADRARAIADADAAKQGLLRDVESSFYRAVYAEQRVHLANAAESLAVDVVRVAERRYQTGDVPRLDVNVARTALARARAGVREAESARELASGDLRRLLGFSVSDSIVVSGDLRSPGDLTLADMLARASNRPDLRVLQAEIDRAEAEARLGGAQRWPELTLGVAWEREEQSDIGPLALVGLTIPLFDRGQAPRDAGRVRTRRLQGEYEALQRAVAIDIETSFSIYSNSVDAVAALEEAMPLVDENEALVRRGYETGQLGLSELVLLRQEVIATRLEYLARLLDSALARVELLASAGFLQ